MSAINGAIQTLEPGGMVELFTLDATLIGGDLSRFHGHEQETPIFWQGQGYFPWPIEARGFGSDSDKPTTPSLRVGNLDGSISALCQFYDDLVGAKLTRRRTLVRFLDPVNFAGGNPTADPNEEFRPETWYIERKISEDNTAVEFELASALDFNGVMLPRRQIVANMCTWGYRSAECGYTGGPVADIHNAPTSNSALDACSKSLTACRMRFGSGTELPYGGFPAAGVGR